MLPLSAPCPCVASSHRLSLLSCHAPAPANHGGIQVRHSHPVLREKAHREPWVASSLILLYQGQEIMIVPISIYVHVLLYFTINSPGLSQYPSCPFIIKAGKH